MMSRSPLPLVAGRFKAPQYRGLSGLGDCPAGLYPNITNPGFCTNLTAAQQAGSSAATVDGRPVSDPSIVLLNDAARLGLQLTPDEATQTAIAREAEAEGAALGIPTSCEVVHNTAPAYGQLAASSLYQTVCSVAGQPGQSGALLIRPNGFATALPGDPRTVYHVAAILKAAAPAGGGGFNLTSGGSSGAAAGGGGFNLTSGGSSTSSGAPLPLNASDPSDSGSVLPGDLLSSLSSLPSWAIYAAAGLAAFFVLGGKK